MTCLPEGRKYIRNADLVSIFLNIIITYDRHFQVHI